MPVTIAPDLILINEHSAAEREEVLERVRLDRAITRAALCRAAPELVNMLDLRIIRARKRRRVTGRDPDLRLEGYIDALQEIRKELIGFPLR